MIRSTRPSSHCIYATAHRVPKYKAGDLMWVKENE